MFDPTPPNPGDMKYVRHSTIGFILWPFRTGGQGNLFHSTIGRTPVIQKEVGGYIVSAGFAHVSARGVLCYGRSESLTIGCRPEDTELLAEQLGLPALPIDTNPRKIRRT